MEKYSWWQAVPNIYNTLSKKNSTNITKHRGLNSLYTWPLVPESGWNSKKSSMWAFDGLSWAVWLDRYKYPRGSKDAVFSKSKKLQKRPLFRTHSAFGPPGQFTFLHCKALTSGFYLATLCIKRIAGYQLWLMARTFDNYFLPCVMSFLWAVRY